MIAEDKVYKIGRISHIHGIRGEVSLTFTDDVWDRSEADYLILRIDGILVPFFMEEYRFRSDTTALIKFQDYDTANAARELCGADVYFPHALTPDRSEDEPYTWKEDPKGLNHSNYRKSLVPKDHIFVLGDNRNNSEDSRFADVDFVPLRLVKGKAAVVFWPFERFRKLP